MGSGTMRKNPTFQTCKPVKIFPLFLIYSETLHNDATNSKRNLCILENLNVNTFLG